VEHSIDARRCGVVGLCWVSSCASGLLETPATALCSRRLAVSVDPLTWQPYPSGRMSESSDQAQVVLRPVTALCCKLDRGQH
jgi:hypothetical protein